jgi:hypothetical protein
MTASKIEGSRRQAVRRTVVTAAIVVAFAPALPSAPALAGDGGGGKGSGGNGGGGSGWQFVTGFDGRRLCQMAGGVLWWRNEIGQFSCKQGPGGFQLHVK